jgi:hypothetical protein
MNLFLYIQSLPQDIIGEIKSFIPTTRLLFLNKNLYLKNHHIVKLMIPLEVYDNYIRDMVRKEHVFVFEKIMQENWKHWLKMKKYKYENIIYDNYFSFLNSYCIENKSPKIRIMLNDFFKNLGISKNQHKNNRIINIKWKH